MLNLTEKIRDSIIKIEKEDSTSSNDSFYCKIYFTDKSILIIRARTNKPNAKTSLKAYAGYLAEGLDYMMYGLYDGKLIPLKVWQELLGF